MTFFRRALFWAATSAVLSVAMCATFLGAEEKKKPASEEQAIRVTLETYVAAYNRGDAQAVAAHWAEDGQWTSPTGEKFVGRKAIAAALQTYFANAKGATIEVREPEIRLLSADAAVEEGRVIVNGPGQAPSESTYLALHVKKNGEWKLDSVRETEISEPPTANAELDELAWLVGEWVDTDPAVQGEAKIVWTKNKTFLNYSFRIEGPGADALEGSQVIGWDPAAVAVRSWMFDSDGGFGEGAWSRKGNQWVVKFRQTLPDGRIAAATNVYTVLDGNTFTWKSIGRQVDGEFLPNTSEIKLVRKSSVKEGKAEKAEKKEAKNETGPKKPANNKK